jgi:hypothetical protein
MAWGVDEKLFNRQGVNSLNILRLVKQKITFLVEE